MGLLANYGREGGWAGLVDPFMSDLDSLLRSTIAGDVMGRAKMTAPSHDRALPSFRHCNY